MMLLRTTGLLAPTLVLVAFSGSVSVAAAKPARVVIVGAAKDALVTEAVTRIRGELAAAGFVAETQDYAPGADPPRLAGEIARESDAAAALVIISDPERQAVDVWLADRLTGKTSVRRIEVGVGSPTPSMNSGARSTPGTHVPDARASEALAVRVVELLRASLLEIVLRSSGASGAREAPPEITRFVESGLSPRARLVGLELGAAALWAFEGTAAVIAPLARLSYHFNPTLMLRLSALGFGGEARVEATAGTAIITQEIAVLELLRGFRPGTRFQPLLSLGAGAYHVGVEGIGIAPYVGKTGGQWAGAGCAGAGAVVHVARHVALAAGVQAVLTVPHSVVRLANVEAATGVRPLVIATVTFLASL